MGADTDTRLDPVVPSVEEMYHDGKYADFVDQNEEIQRDWFHHSLLLELEASMCAHRCSGNANNNHKLLLRAIDLGCGSGIFAKRLLEQRSGNVEKLQVVGVDLSSTMLQRARAGQTSKSLQFLQGDVRTAATSIPELTTLHHEFDLVVSSFCICHMMTRTDLHAFFRTVATLLRPGGTTAHLLIPLPENDAPVEGEVAPVHCAELPVSTVDAGNAGDDDDDDGTSCCVVYDSDWSSEDFIQSATQAGLVDVSIAPCTVAREALEAQGVEYWERIEADMGQYMVLRARAPL